MKTFSHWLSYTIVIIFLYSCGNQQEQEEEYTKYIEITKEQFATSGIELGKIESKTFRSIVKCNGVLAPLPNGMAIVNTPISGVIKNIFSCKGKFVEKNQKLLEITGNELIELQKNFAEASVNFSRLKADFHRVKSIYQEKVISDKDYLMAESEYKTSMAQYNALKMKIELIGLSVSEIENGRFYNSFTINAPIKGYVSNLNVNIGSYVETKSELIEIIAPEMYLLEMSVFLTDVSKIKNGQTVRFKSVNSEKKYTGIINSIGVAVDDASKTIKCCANVSNRSMNDLKINEFAECEIIIDIDTVKAIPDEAIIKAETESFILVLKKHDNEKYYFEKLRVNPGRKHKGYTEVKDKIIDEQIALRGVYNILL
jgi:cobalt-zinc-cadmium efflux system membrane fusion protein